MMTKKKIQCPIGHEYDSMYSVCPDCGISELDIKGTRSHPDNNSENASPDNTEKYYKKEDPVVGWLVCIEGKDRGTDYRIRAEWNFIGQDTDMDVRIKGDNSISGHRHAKLNFDPPSGEFWIAPGEARKNTYVNGRPVIEASRLKVGDQIRVGNTTLLFVPLCGENFTWEIETSPENTATTNDTQT